MINPTKRDLPGLWIPSDLQDGSGWYDPPNLLSPIDTSDGTSSLSQVSKFLIWAATFTGWIPRQVSCFEYSPDDLDQAFKGGISRGKELGGFNSIFLLENGP